MRLRHSMLPALVLGVGLFVGGCNSADNTRNRTTDDRLADHTGAVGGTGGAARGGIGHPTTSGSPSGTGDTSGTGTDLDRRGRTGSETGMHSGDRSTTGGGTSLSGSDQGNNPNRKDGNR